MKTKKSSHTPGPWKAWTNSGGGFVNKLRYVIEGQHIDDGESIDVPTAYVIRQNDARLIAAAPDMLAALKNLTSASTLAAVRQAQEDARAAIAKAEGRS